MTLCGLALHAGPPAPQARAYDPSAPPDPTGSLRADALRTLEELKSIPDLDTKVARLIDRLAQDDPAKVQAAATALVTLGPPAVPAIIRRMDDRSPMKAYGLMFENKAPGAFEGIYHTSVDEVVDVLCQVLGQITWLSFGYIYVPRRVRQRLHPERVEPVTPEDVQRRQKLNAQRDAVVAGWRAYLARLQSTPPVPNKSLPGRGPGR